jgi:hypothetical protein
MFNSNFIKMKTVKSYTFQIIAVFVISLPLIVLSCKKDEEIVLSKVELAAAEYARLKASGNYIEFSVPDQNPGPPFYARIADMGAERLFMESGNTVIIPMMRQVECIDPDFNLLSMFHVPDAFFCPLVLSGKGLTEPNSPPDVFPVIAYLESNNMPVWFVDKQPLLNAMQDGVLTLTELETLNPKKGVASWYIEYNKPRTVEDHLLVIESEGTIPATGQRFEYTVNSIDKSIQEVELRIW